MGRGEGGGEEGEGRERGREGGEVEGSRRREKNGERLLYISIQEQAGDGVWYTSLILCTVY